MGNGAALTAAPAVSPVPPFLCQPRAVCVPRAGAPVAEQGRRGAAAAGGGALLHGGGHRGGGQELCEDHPQPASCGTCEIPHIL